VGVRRDSPADPPASGDGAIRRVLAYHEFSCLLSRDVYQLHPKVFQSQLRALQTTAQPGVRLQITFDDAHRSQLELATPLLEESGLRGLFFAPAGWIGARPAIATWNQLRALIGAGHAVGSHGQTHTLLTHCSPAQLREELVRSRTTLEDGLGQSVSGISMPGGRWNATVAAACLAAGYRELYTSEPGSTLQWIGDDTGKSLAIVGRLGVRRTMVLHTLVGYAAADPLVTIRLKVEYRAKQALKRALGDVSYQRLWRRLLRSPVETAF